MAGKKKASKKKKVKAKNVEHKGGGAENIEKEVLVDAPDEQAEPAPAPAIVREPVMKTVSKGGGVEYLPKSEYDKKYGKKVK